MKKFSILFLKFVLIIIALLLLAFGIFGVPKFIEEMAQQGGIYHTWAFVFSVSIYPAIILFLGALFNAFQLLRYIDRHHAFSKIAVKALRRIKEYTVIVSVLLYVGLLPVAYMIADDGDTPGLIIIVFLFASAPLVIGIFAYVMERVLREAIEIQEENKLTI